MGFGLLSDLDFVFALDLLSIDFFFFFSLPYYLISFPDSPKPTPSNDLSGGISVQLRATPKFHRLSASVQKRVEPTFLCFKLKPTPKKNDNDGQ
jgi:hypothetical protein